MKDSDDITTSQACHSIGQSSSYQNVPTNLSSSSSKRKSESLANFKKDDSDLLKSTLKLNGLGSMRSDPNMRPNPRTSMSQLKLFQLANTTNYKDQIDSYDIEELRNGFFDPVYVKSTHIGSSDEHVKTNIPSSFKPKLTIRSHLEKIFQQVNTSKIILLKFCIAYFISILLCLINKPGNWFGKYRFFLPISTLINHPVHSIGAQIEITVLSIVGLAIGLGWSSLALYISTATQPTRNHQGGILAGSLFIGIFFMGWFKAYFIRFYYLFLSAGFVLIFLSTSLDLNTTVIDWKNTWYIAIPYLFGILVSLVISLVVFPDIGNQKIMDSVLDSVKSIKDLIIAFTEAQHDDDFEKIAKLGQLQKNLTERTLMLSENFREYLSEVKFSVFKDEDLKKIRNHLNFAIGPLRVIPNPTNMYFKPSDSISSSDGTKVQSSTDASGTGTAMVSGIATPLPRPNAPQSFIQHPNFGKNNKLLYTSVISDAFNDSLFKLLAQMIENLSEIEHSIKFFGKMKLNQKTAKVESLEALKQSQLLLKKRVWQIDLAYKKFTKSEYFCRELLNEETVIDMFLFLRYSRQSATMLISLSEVVYQSCEHVKGWGLYWYNYPWNRYLRRLPKQCLRDQGADSIFYYFETKIDVDDAFERIYNLNTSRRKQEEKQHVETQERKTGEHSITDPDPHRPKTVRAIDHNDFNYHSTANPLRYKLWRLTRRLADTETKYAFKVAFVLTFLSLPAWLKKSNEWYYKYNCFWAPLLVYYFLSPRNSGNWKNLLTRTACWFIGCFWGWAANQARHFQNAIVIGVFAVLISIPFAFGFLVKPHPRSSLVALMSFTIISLNCYVEADSSSADVFKYTWITSLAVLISVITAIFTNWLVWPFIAKKELYKSCSSLLSHIGQCYQTVTERYLYRDEKDDPTGLTLELANIREVRMSQSIFAVKELLQRSKNEHDYHHNLKHQVFASLLNSCELILEKTIEARISGLYFHVWEQDKDEQTTQALLSARRDSVATVIYLFYILSNAFETRSNLPRYLPSAIAIRKRLYDIIAKLEVQKEEDHIGSDSIATQLEKRLASLVTHDQDYGKSHWTEVHGMAFSRAFTTITEELENVISFSKEILGEEGLFDD